MRAHCTHCNLSNTQVICQLDQRQSESRASSGRCMCLRPGASCLWEAGSRTLQCPCLREGSGPAGYTEAGLQRRPHGTSPVHNDAKVTHISSEELREATVLFILSHFLVPDSWDILLHHAAVATPLLSQKALYHGPLPQSWQPGYSAKPSPKGLRAATRGPLIPPARRRNQP